MKRKGEEGRTWFRSDRFLHIGNEWYFLTREDTQEGPFSTKEEAERELMLYIRHADDAFYKHVD